MHFQHSVVQSSHRTGEEQFTAHNKLNTQNTELPVPAQPPGCVYLTNQDACRTTISPISALQIHHPHKLLTCHSPNAPNICCTSTLHQLIYSITYIYLKCKLYIKNIFIYTVHTQYIHTILRYRILEIYYIILGIELFNTAVLYVWIYTCVYSYIFI